MSDDPPPSPEDSQEHFQRLNKHIWWVGISLGAFALVVFLLGISPLSTAWHVRILLPLIAVEAGIQVVYFMHLKSERPLIFKFLVFTLVFVAGLFMLTQLADSNPLHSTLIALPK